VLLCKLKINFQTRVRAGGIKQVSQEGRGQLKPIKEYINEKQATGKGLAKRGASVLSKKRGQRKKSINCQQQFGMTAYEFRGKKEKRESPIHLWGGPKEAHNSIRCMENSGRTCANSKMRERNHKKNQKEEAVWIRTFMGPKLILGNGGKKE